MSRFKYVSIVLLLSACVSVNKSIFSRAHLTDPVSRDAVRVYLADDSIPMHERIALMHAKGEEDATDEIDMINKFREEAGKLGANAIVLGEVRDPSTADRVAGVVFGMPTFRRGQAMAIYVPTLTRSRQDRGSESSRM